MSPERTASGWRCARSGRQTPASRGHTPPSPGVTAFAQRRPRKMIFVNCGGTDTGHDPPGRSALFDDLARLAAEEHNRALRRPRDCPRVAETASDASEVVKFRCSRWLGGKTSPGGLLFLLQKVRVEVLRPITSGVAAVDRSQPPIATPGRAAQRDRRANADTTVGLGAVEPFAPRLR